MVTFLLTINPFFEANFSSLPMRSVCVFANPGGLGIHPGAELLFTYHPDKIMSAVYLQNMSFGWIRKDTINYYEIGVGYKFPGAFSCGYAYQFGDTSASVFGITGQVSSNLFIGYKTTFGEYNHMFGGISIMPFRQYITLSGDLEYEGINDILNYYYGIMIQPIEGVKLYGLADQDFNWSTGLELSFGKLKLAGAYSSIDKKFNGGVILSAQTYSTFIPKPDELVPPSI